MESGPERLPGVEHGAPPAAPGGLLEVWLAGAGPDAIGHAGERLIPCCSPEPWWDPGPLEPEQVSWTSPGWVDRLRASPALTRDLVGNFVAASWDDHRHYYSAENLGLLALGLAVAAPLANSPADQEVRDWYQRNLRSRGLDRWADAAKVPGNHFVIVPLFVGAAWAGQLWEDTATGSVLHAWGMRTARAALVGAPSVGILQHTLGASRPGEGNSHWHPFRDKNGVAGHGFIGAVPFLAAASLTDNPWLRYPLFAASFATDWSRINDDAHYLSQAILGWWIAYLAVRSVETSDREQQSISILPAPAGGGIGVSVLVRY